MKSTQMSLKLYAIEKNQNAIITLRHKKVSDALWDNVTIVETDMREWNAPEKADVLVSELLGSFGDNELSPECLDGAMRLLKDDGVSIPSTYTSYVAPIMSEKLYSRVGSFGKAKSFGTFYVVKLNSVCHLSEPKKCFKFEHSNKTQGINIDNSRYEALDFRIMDQDAIIHGFAGYFEAVLYNNVVMSILPSTFSEGMFSWFPMFIPLQYPIFVNANCTVTFNIWRCVGPKFVWYEWCVTEPEVSHIHNAGGSCSKVLL